MVSVRFLQIGLGPLGCRLASDVVRRGLGEIVAAIDVDEDLCGRPLRKLAPETESDLPIAATLDDAAAGDVALVATVSQLDRCAPLLHDLLTRGLAVISTCEELSWPTLRHPKIASALDETARSHGGRLLGTGINPGFLMDVFPLMATAVCTEVRSLTVTRIQDAENRRLPFQRKVGATLDEATFRDAVAEGRLGHVGLPESLHLLAHTMGLELEHWEERTEPVLAERELDSGLGAIAAGHVAGLAQEAHGTTSDDTVLRLEFRAAVGERESYDRVRIEGVPPVDLLWKGGVPGDVSTAAVLLNAVRPLLAAPPGLHTMASIAPARWHRGG
jgi:4-hydroxy-tetrahydrodipicolinate reductase